jgi:hypothetical protein
MMIDGVKACRAACPSDLRLDWQAGTLNPQSTKTEEFLYLGIQYIRDIPVLLFLVFGKSSFLEVGFGEGEPTKF